MWMIIMEMKFGFLSGIKYTRTLVVGSKYNMPLKVIKKRQMQVIAKVFMLAKNWIQEVWVSICK